MSRGGFTPPQFGGINTRSQLGGSVQLWNKEASEEFMRQFPFRFAASTLDAALPPDKVAGPRYDAERMSTVDR